MEEKPGIPSAGWIIWTDYPSFITVAFAIMIWIVDLAWIPGWRSDGPIMSAFLVPYVLGFTVLATLICAGILLYRIWMLQALFRCGETAWGKISSFELKRDRGRVEYDYIYHRQSFTTSVTVHRNRKTKALRKGERVVLIVDPKNPRRALIRDLYR